MCIRSSPVRESSLTQELGLPTLIKVASTFGCARVTFIEDQPINATLEIASGALNSRGRLAPIVAGILLVIQTWTTF